MKTEIKKGDVVYHKADGRRLVVVQVNFPEWKMELGRKYTPKQAQKARQAFEKSRKPAGYKCSYLNYMRDYSIRDFYPHEVSQTPIKGFNSLTKQTLKDTH